jgi:hypothetical protein
MSHFLVDALPAFAFWACRNFWYCFMVMPPVAAAPDFLPASGVPAVLGLADSLPGAFTGVLPALGVALSTFETTALVLPTALAVALAVCLAPPLTLGAAAPALAVGAAFPAWGTTWVLPCLNYHSPAPPSMIPWVTAPLAGARGAMPADFASAAALIWA